MIRSHSPAQHLSPKKGAPNPNREAGFLTDAYAFEGQAWFRKEICIDPELFDTDMGMLPIKLTLERTRMTTLWINGRLVGSCNSLCTPHVYDITDFVTKPLVEILVLVENTGYPTKGGHLTSPDTQSNWNGITGQMTLEVFPEVYVDHVQAYPDPEHKNVTLTMQLHGASTASFSATGSVVEDNEEDTIPLFQAQLTADENGMASVTIPLDEAYYEWSEYHPALYYLFYTIDEADCGSVSFGMRRFCAEGSRFTINGQPTMLRGKHDGLIFSQNRLCTHGCKRVAACAEHCQKLRHQPLPFPHLLSAGCSVHCGRCAGHLHGTGTAVLGNDRRSRRRGLQRGGAELPHRTGRQDAGHIRQPSVLCHVLPGQRALGAARNGWERSCGTTRKGTAAICTPRAATTSSIFR